MGSMPRGIAGHAILALVKRQRVNVTSANAQMLSGVPNHWYLSVHAWTAKWGAVMHQAGLNRSR